MLSLPDASYQANNIELKKLINAYIEYFGDNCDLNWIDTAIYLIGILVM